MGMYKRMKKNDKHQLLLARYIGTFRVAHTSNLIRLYNHHNGHKWPELEQLNSTLPFSIVVKYFSFAVYYWGIKVNVYFVHSRYIYDT